MAFVATETGSLNVVCGVFLRISQKNVEAHGIRADLHRTAGTDR